MAYDPDRFASAVSSQAFSLVARAGLDAAVLGTWDADLLREPRTCVPVDVQALVVPFDEPAGTEGVRLVGALSPGRAAEGIDAQSAVIGPEPFADPEPRAPGVHLHWAMPDALLRGTLTDGGLGLPALPDRWLVLRLLAPAKAARAVARGWVLDAGTGRAWSLSDWTGDPAAPGGSDVPGTAVVAPEGLTGTAGGTLTWTAGYDAASRRFAWHDPLDDLAADPELAGALPGGAVGGRATYVVVGWWSRGELDPLDEVRGTRALDRRLAALGWRREPVPDPPPPVAIPAESAKGARQLEDLGLDVAGRWDLSADVVEAPAVLGGQALGRARFVGRPRPPRPEASTVLHGAVVGVPVARDGLADRVRAADLRPDPSAAEVGLGEHLFDALGALTARRAAQRLGVSSPDELAVVERLVTAFVQSALPRLADPAGAAELDEDVHGAGFETVASGEPGVVDRLVDGRVAVPPRGRRIGRVGGRLGDRRPDLVLAPGETKRIAVARLVREGGVAETVAGVAASGAPSAAESAEPRVRTEERPAPPRHVPSDPYLALRGAGRALRHGGDGRWSSDGTLLVRAPSQLVDAYAGVLSGADVLPTLPSGAVPAESTALAREALLLSPHLARWLADRAAERSGGDDEVRRGLAVRVDAEHLLRYDLAGAYSTRAATEAASKPVVDAVWRPGDVDPDATRLVAAVREHSLLHGVEPSPVGITAWAQPWAPAWLEFDVAVGSTGSTEGWALGQTDLVAGDGTDAGAAPTVTTVRSRVPLTTGTAVALGGAVARYVSDEARRDARGVGEVDDELSDALALLAGVAGSPDLLGATLDGVRARLLGLPARAMRARRDDGSLDRPVPDALPHLLAAGHVRLVAARVLDAFGRVLDLDPAGAAVPQRLAVPDLPGALLRAPRFAAPARVRLRLVGADATSPADAVDARVDEADPGGMVNPVAGFLLPDHVDESLEVFATDGTPLGELVASGAGGPTGGGVAWEPAPGRPVPVDAPPSAGLAPAQASLAALAAGMVATDAVTRAGGRAEDAAESALSALLRAIDTTLWTVDPVAGAGSAELAAIVGRPVAVVRAVLELDVADDLDALDLDPEGRAARAAAYAALAAVGVRVRLGELTRSDDGLLAWFVDDDFRHARLVDAAVADLAREAGPGRGHLAAWGSTPEEPDVDPLRHPYLLAEDELVLRPGVPRLVTLLMAPGAAVHVSSGVVPRSRTSLARSWFAAGLDRLVPSVRVGPVLVDPGAVRLPLVAALGEEQTLTTREGPLGWRDDAILAAGASAVLPDRASVLREGWIRVAPGEPEPPATASGRT